MKVVLTARKGINNDEDQFGYNFVIDFLFKNGDTTMASISYFGGELARMSCSEITEVSVGEESKIEFPSNTFRIYARKYFSKIAEDVSRKEPHIFDPKELMVWFFNSAVNERV